MHETKVWIYGTIPPPVGGVAVFISRLIDNCSPKLAGLVDPYFAIGKPLLNINHICAKRPGLLAKLLTMLQLLRLRKFPMLINGSRPEGLLALLPFLLFRSGKTALLLHHGDLQKSLIERPWLTGLVRLAIKPYQQIGCLSETQKQFYRGIGISDSRLVLVETYLPPSKPSGSLTASPLMCDVIQWIGSSETPVFIASGYAFPYYNHHWGIDFLDASKKLKGRYLLCIYGPKTETLDELQKLFADRGDAKCVYGLQPDEFDEVLARCKVYIRPTSTDSYGMATRDALQRNLKVVASNACERAEGIVVHAVGDQQAFFRCLDTALTEGDSQAVSNPSATTRLSRLSIDRLIDQLSENDRSDITATI